MRTYIPRIQHGGIGQVLELGALFLGSSCHLPARRCLSSELVVGSLVRLGEKLGEKWNRTKRVPSRLRMIHDVANIT